MHVLLFSCSYAPRHGGLETTTRRLAVELTRVGHEVTVVTNRYPRRLPGREEIDGIPVYREIYSDFPVWRGRDSFASLMKALALLPLAPIALVRLFFLVRRLRPDVVNVHYLTYPAAYMLAVAGLTKVPIVLSFHGSDLSTALESSRQRRFLRWAARRAAVLTTCSHYLAGLLQRTCPPSSVQRVVVAHNGVDSSMSAPSEPDESKSFVLVVARLSAVKGVDVAVRAVAELQRRGVPVRLVIAGDGPQLRSLRKLSRELNVHESVTFLGSLPHAGVSSLMEQALFCVVPSRHEAFGTVCLEAMAMGKAVVASRVGGIPEIVVDGVTGTLVAPARPETLADAIADLLRHPDRRHEMGTRGQVRAQKYFDWDRTVACYLQAFEAAVVSEPGEIMERGTCA